MERGEKKYKVEREVMAGGKREGMKLDRRKGKEREGEDGSNARVEREVMAGGKTRNDSG